MLDNKVRFIREVIADKLKVKQRKRTEVIADLKHGKYDTFFDTNGHKKKKEESMKDEESDSEEENLAEFTKVEKKSGYEYLLGMPLWCLTVERIEQLEKQQKKKKHELEELEKTSIETLWEQDLDDFSNALEVCFTFFF